MKDILLEVSDHIADVRLARSEKMNALTQSLLEQLIDAGATIAKRANVRAVVFSGEGRAFCAGIDTSTFAEMSRGRRPDIIADDSDTTNIGQDAVLMWRNLPVPVIAAVHGVAFGGGLQLMLGADIRVVHPAAQLSIMEVRWGLVPDMAGLWVLRSLMRADVMADLCYTGRTVTGPDALSLGLATRLSENPRTTAFDIAREIAQKSPDAIRAAKRIMMLDDESLQRRILAAEVDEQAAIVAQPNQFEAVMAIKEGRAPQFQDH